MGTVQVAGLGSTGERGRGGGNGKASPRCVHWSGVSFERALSYAAPSLGWLRMRLSQGSARSNLPGSEADAVL